MKDSNIKKIISIAVAVFLMLILIRVDPLWIWEYRVQDAAFQRQGTVHPSIVVIGIDEETLNTLGPFHRWSRSLMAEAVNILNSDIYARPAVIGIDVMYTEPGRDAEADAALAEAFRAAGNVVLASAVEVGVDPQALTTDLTIIGHQKPFPALLPYTSYGLVNGIFDRDGVVRNALLWEYFQGERLYSFPAAIAKMYKNAGSYEFMPDNSETFIRYTGLPGPPLGDFFALSFSDIFAPDFNPAEFADAIVLIGPYTPRMRDHYAVPISPYPMYGVEIHANVVQVILDGAYKQLAPEWAGTLIVAGFLILGMAFGEFVRNIRIVLGVFLGAGILYYFFAWAVYRQGYVLPVLAPLFSLSIVFLYQFIYGYILQSIEKNRLRNIFGKYVDPKLVNTLIESGEADNNDVGRKKHIAVMFVDVHGFTPVREKLRDNPEMIVEILNEYLELSSSSVFDNDGSVDKFIGKATMALFNGFVPTEDHIYKAVKAAWDMVQGANSINESIKERFGQDIGFCAGVHCGEAIVGNLGPFFRKDYTAIGDTVNTAARLKSVAARSQVLISRDVYDLLKDRIKAESIGEIPLKGKSVPLEIFSLTGI